MQVAPITAFQPTPGPTMSQTRATGDVAGRIVKDADAANGTGTHGQAWQNTTSMGAPTDSTGAQQHRQPGSPSQTGTTPPSGDKAFNKPGSANNNSDTPTKPNGELLTEAEHQQLEQLKRRDREVRQHEMAHQSVGGSIAGSASYDFERGPDGAKYAVAGEVPVKASPVPGDPQATIAKMEQVRAAALAPAEPSSQDHKVAAQASQQLLAARLELAQQESEMDDARSTITDSQSESQRDQRLHSLAASTTISER